MSRQGRRTPASDVGRGGGTDAVQVAAECNLSRDQLTRVRRRLMAVARYSRRPQESARLTLRAGARPRGAVRVYVADARMHVDGGVLVAHAVGPSPEKAASDACERLGRQLRDLVRARVAQRNEPAVMRRCTRRGAP
jgi:ribosome-associated translation inhibitor RaiA